MSGSELPFSADDLSERRVWRIVSAALVSRGDTADLWEGLTVAGSVTGGPGSHFPPDRLNRPILK